MLTNSLMYIMQENSDSITSTKSIMPKITLVSEPDKRQQTKS